MSAPCAVLWSGGKDCALALIRAREAGLDVRRLLSFYDSETGRVRFHDTTVEMLKLQAEAAGLPLQPVATSWADMGANLDHALARLRAEGFRSVILGDIHLVDVRAWYEARVTGAGLEHVEPIWGEPPAALLSEFVVGGGRAVVTCVDLERLDASWLGAIVDERFPAKIGATGVDPCGENGEYHTFACAGPAFKHEISWVPGTARREGRFLQMELRPITV